MYPHSLIPRPFQAYKNFETRITTLHEKLTKEKLPELEKEREMVSISPMPSPDYDAPSPEADEMELELPDDTTPTREGGAETPEPPPQDLNSRLHSMMNEPPATEVATCLTRTSLFVV